MDGWGAAQLFATSVPMANNCKILGSEYPYHGISFISPLLRWPLAGAGDQGWDQGGFIAGSWGMAGPIHAPELTGQPPLCPWGSVVLHSLKGVLPCLARSLPFGL